MDRVFRAVLMSESSDATGDEAGGGDGEQTVCFCHNVKKATLRKAIQAGAKTLVDIQAETCASTGCGGCESEVLEILEAELAKSR